MKQVDYSTFYWQNDKVRLRPIRTEDWRENYIFLFDSDARFLIHSDIGLPIDEQTAEQKWKDFIGDGFDKNGKIKLTIETLDGLNIGGINLSWIDERHGAFGVGLHINREYRGQGYGTSAMKILLDYAFNERRLHKFQTFVIEGNIASEKMLQKLGCVKEGVIRESIFHKGRYWDEIHYGLLANEFNEIYKKTTY